MPFIQSYFQTHPKYNHTYKNVRALLLVEIIMGVIIFFHNIIIQHERTEIIFYLLNIQGSRKSNETCEYKKKNKSPNLFHPQQGFNIHPCFSPFYFTITKFSPGPQFLYIFYVVFFYYNFCNPVLVHRK